MSATRRIVTPIFPSFSLSPLLCPSVLSPARSHNCICAPRYPRLLYLGRGAGISSVLKATHCHPNLPLHSYLPPSDASLSLLLILSICGPIRIRSLDRRSSACVPQIDSWTETNLPPPIPATATEERVFLARHHSFSSPVSTSASCHVNCVRLSKKGRNMIRLGFHFLIFSSAFHHVLFRLTSGVICHLILFCLLRVLVFIADAIFL